MHLSVVAVPLPQPEGRSVLTNQGASLCRVWLPARFPWLGPLGIPETAPWLLSRQAEGRAVRRPEKALASTGWLRCTHSPSLPQAPSAKLCRLQGHQEGEGGWEEEARGCRTLHRVRENRQTAQPLPRAGPSPRWLEVDKDRRTCKMATGSRQNEQAGMGPPSGPLPPERVPNPACSPTGPGPGLPSPVLPTDRRALV